MFILDSEASFCLTDLTCVPKLSFSQMSIAGIIEILGLVKLVLEQVEIWVLLRMLTHITLVVEYLRNENEEFSKPLFPNRYLDGSYSQRRVK